MLYHECFVTPLATIYRSRTLPEPGQILYRVGDQVVSDRVVARTDVPSGYRLLNVEKMLGTRVSNIGKVMTKRIGEAVEEGDVIAATGSLFKKECLSPVTGKILDARNNRILIEIAPRHIELRAFYPGQIVNLIGDRGVLIEITGALVQGIWGTGRELKARLDLAVPDGSTPLTADAITAAHMGTILIGGRTLDTDVIAAAVRNQVNAVIVGSITEDLVSEIEASQLSLIVTEGFGNFAMNDKAFEVLSSYVGRETCFNPITQTRWNVQRPEVLIPLPAEGRPPAAEYGASLTKGTLVRVIRAPYENKLGKVVSKPPRQHRLESGILVQGVEVDLESVGRVFIPFENLEIMR